MRHLLDLQKRHLEGANVMEKKEQFYTVGGNVNWCSHKAEWCRGSFKN